MKSPSTTCILIFDAMTTSNTNIFPRPVSGDCSDYYFKYIDQVPEVDIATLLHTQRDWFADFIESLSPEQAQHRYEPGKWSLAESIGHVLDTERVFAYRMMCISRGEQNSLPGFEQDDYANNSIYHNISPAELANEWRAVRGATVYLLWHMDAEMASRTGTANNVHVKASAYPYIMAGHVIHHHQIYQERYLQQPALS